MTKQSYKIVFSGSVGAGKTTAISQLSDIEIVSTDVANRDKSYDKALTTVGIDYGHIDLDDNLRLLLYGTPGQDRFSFMWRIAAENALGVIVLINGLEKDFREHLDRFVSFYKQMEIEHIVIGITHLDETEGHKLQEVNNYLIEKFGEALPLFPCDARQKEEVLFLLEVLIAKIEAGLY